MSNQAFQKINAMMKHIEQLQKQFIKDYAAVVELWLPVKGYPNYEVSSFGRVKSKLKYKIIKLRKNRYGYPIVDLRVNTKKKTITLHRLVANAFIENTYGKACVDHIDNNRSNNYVNNLRWATFSENQMNKCKQSNNTSGVVGVHWFKPTKKWCARIKIDRVTKNLGYFDTVEAAKHAREKAVKKIFGEYAYKA